MPNYEDYEQITDTLGWLDSSVQYKFVTRLASKDKNGNKDSFHKEYTYRSNYNNIDMVTSIKRSFDSFIVIDNFKDKDIYIQIRAQNMIMLQNILNQMVGYLFDEKLWGIKNKTLIIKGKPSPLYMQQLPMSKWISFELIVIEYNGEFDKGIRIVLSDESKYVDVRIDVFMGFVYIMNTFNMYLASMSHINYLQRPPFGTNMITFDNPPRNYNKVGEEGIETKAIRTIEQSKPKSFFDKINKIS